MKQSPHILIVLAGFLFLLNSCKRENMCDCFKSRGQTVLETRKVSSFYAIQVFDKIDVYFTQDTLLTEPVVQVKTGKHLLSNISVSAQNDTLFIKNKNKCNFVRGSHNDVTVYVTAPYVKYFVQNGVGTIFGTNTVVQDTVYMNIINSGDIRLDVDVLRLNGHTHGIGDHYVTGKAKEFYTHIKGQGFVHAENMVAIYSYIYFDSNGEARVNVRDQLDCAIVSTGNVYLSGRPPMVSASITGSGKLIKL